MPLEIGEVQDVITARNGKLISSCSDLDLQNILKKLFVMTGLRPHHFPFVEEEMYLKNYIFVKYANKTDQEILLAWDLAIQNKLDIEPEEVNPFDQFSPLYFAKIMTAYHKWYIRVCKNKETMDPIIQKTNLPPAKKELSSNEWEDMLYSCKKMEFDLIPGHFIYDHFEKIGRFNFSTFRKKQFFNKAINMYPKFFTTETEKMNFYKMKNKNEFSEDTTHRLRGIAKSFAIMEFLDRKIPFEYMPADLETIGFHHTKVK